MLSSKEHGDGRDGDGDDEEHEVLVEDISTLKGVVVTSDVRGSAPSQNHKGRKELKGGPGYYKGDQATIRGTGLLSSLPLTVNESFQTRFPQVL